MCKIIYFIISIIMSLLKEQTTTTTQKQYSLHNKNYSAITSKQYLNIYFDFDKEENIHIYIYIYISIKNQGKPVLNHINFNKDNQFIISNCKLYFVLHTHIEAHGLSSLLNDRCMQIGLYFQTNLIKYHQFTFHFRVVKIIKI